ncbi:S-adenosyl-L-methionine-dependent methyltransferase [Xylaria bambusicola]|uniref:S-adenosyl-L-methionine-dependent methyltransferase n=1 Tax=Xylaria bambusicola TaxID=326684 RepID=UPI002008D7FA|nr:S-adenosyl-L-methionine-dependent methyltransferase [Xylaria bambusicola]KAI0509601.1 S-adenosyl-L-methionine-dependent methyltransferase [Xylaria bambusicola]
MAAEASQSAAEPAATPASISAAPVIPTTHWTQPQGDQRDDEGEEDYFDDGDSALGDDAASTTASLSASILEYRTLHGRTYHSLQGTADHWTPNDDAHLESMDCVHHLLTLLFDNKLCLAPVPEGPKKVLDIGCGTGIWAIDFADAHPEAEVIGTDLSPMQPEWVPPNLKFEIDDCTQPWTYAENSQDFIHIRYLFGAIEKWDELYQQAYRACKPGGWVEIVDPSVNLRSDDGSVREGTAMYDWGRLFNEAATINKRSMSMVDDGKRLEDFKKAGFVNAQSRRFKLPATPWAKDHKMQQLGAFSQLAMEQDLDGYAMFLFTNALGWSPQQVTVYLARMRKEMRDMRMQPYFIVESVYGQKP